MKKIGRANELKQFVPGLFGEDKYKKITKENIDKLTKGLENSINQNSSLILLKKEAEHLGYDEFEFNEAFKNIRNKGYKISPMQERDLPKLNKPTITFLRKLFG